METLAALEVLAGLVRVLSHGIRTECVGSNTMLNSVRCVQLYDLFIGDRRGCDGLLVPCVIVERDSSTPV